MTLVLEGTEVVFVLVVFLARSSHEMQMVSCPCTLLLAFYLSAPFRSYLFTSNM